VKKFSAIKNMTILTEKLTLLSEGDFFATNITEQVRDVVRASGVQEGIVSVFYQHTTGAILIIEHEAGILVDLEDVLERMIPISHDYKHHLRGYDENGAAHVRAALLNSSVTIPLLDGDLLLGTYQEILAIDMDPKVKTRTVIVQVMGE
jgi:secondary thiamine-phosphate synthase enzyme